MRQGSRALYADAELFDQLYRRRTGDVRFYVDIANRFGGPVLELGVGSGRVASALARARSSPTEAGGAGIEAVP